jgi:hypothetical protein
MKTLLVVFAMIGCAGSAFADARGVNAKEFIQQIEKYRTSCGSDICQAPFEQKTIFSFESPKQDDLSADLKADLQQVANAQAQVWGDTILEGDYFADGPTQLDIVTSIYENNKLIGYKLSYSEHAWFTGECDFDGDESTLSDCTEGRIQESTYSSADFKTFFRDEDDFADFTH